jgi:hypothetical protein
VPIAPTSHVYEKVIDLLHEVVYVLVAVAPHPGEEVTDDLFERMLEVRSMPSAKPCTDRESRETSETMIWSIPPFARSFIRLA